MSSIWDECAIADSPDPDIAGVGVIAAFITSSCLSILSICLYLLVTRSNLDLLRDGTFGRGPTESINPIDSWARKTFAVPFVRLVTKSKWVKKHIGRLHRALYSFAMTLADTQLVTGIAMLSAAVIKLHKDSISVYHFTMVTNLAWLSSGVHLLSLYAIRLETIGSMKRHRRWIGPFQNPSDVRPWLKKLASTFPLGGDVLFRVLNMLMLAALLLYCTYVSASDGWDYNYDRQASCAIGRRKSGTPLAWMVVNYVLLIHGYTIQCLLLWPAASIWWMDKVRHVLIDDRAMETPGPRMPRWRRILVSCHYAMTSEALGVVFNGLVWFSLGLWGIQADRIYVHGNWGGMGAENEIEGFGQLVPILVLGSPFLQALQTYCGESRTAYREHQLDNDDRAHEIRILAEGVLCLGLYINGSDTDVPIPLGVITHAVYDT